MARPSDIGIYIPAGAPAGSLLDADTYNDVIQGLESEWHDRLRRLQELGDAEATATLQKVYRQMMRKRTGGSVPVRRRV